MTLPRGRNIVFVVGAGASSDFGFPLGDGLALGIRNKIDLEFREGSEEPTSGPLRSALDAVGLNDDHLEAARALRTGLGPGDSIDRFLFRRRNKPAVRELGMMAVAEVILEAERTSPLSNFDRQQFERNVNALRVNENSWPAVLLNLLIGDERGPDEIDESVFDGISFLIFNYDRCVEQLLFHFLRWRHGLPERLVLEIIRAIPMLHIYGVLGDAFDGPVPFGASSVELASVAKQLQTYHEEITDRHRQGWVSAMMARAEKVCFLGFGFHPTNFERLFPGNELHAKQLWGTAMHCEGSPSFQLAKASEGSQFANCNPTAFIRDHGEALLNGEWFD